MNKCLFTICALLLSLAVQSQEKELYEKESFIISNDTLLYRVLYPNELTPNEKYPLILFLHGAGERGHDNEKQLVHGASLFLAEENRNEHPAVVIFPQCPKQDYWSNVKRSINDKGKKEFNFSVKAKPTKALQLVMSLMDSLKSIEWIDTSRIYVMGLSMGGMGTFEIARRMPELFAAAIPICGGGDSEEVGAYANEVSFWIFHGKKDDIVSPQYSMEMVEALKRYDANLKFTLFSDANHNSWDLAFSEPEILNWLFSQHK